MFLNDREQVHLIHVEWLQKITYKQSGAASATQNLGPSLYLVVSAAHAVSIT